MRHQIVKSIWMMNSVCKVLLKAAREMHSDQVRSSVQRGDMAWKPLKGASGLRTCYNAAHYYEHAQTPAFCKYAPVNVTGSLTLPSGAY